MPNDPDPLTRAIAVEWLRAAAEDPAPAGLVECWNCHQWRPDYTADDGPCPICAAVFIAF